MDEKLKKLSDLIQEADRVVEKIAQESQGIRAVEQNVVRMKACLKMLRIGIVEPLEI